MWGKFSARPRSSPAWTGPRGPPHIPRSMSWDPMSLPRRGPGQGCTRRPRFVCFGCRNNYRRLGSPKHTHRLPPGPGGWASVVRARAGLVPPEASLLGVKMATFPPCPPVLPALCVRPHLLRSFGIRAHTSGLVYLNHFIKVLIPKYSHTLRRWALALRHGNLGDTTESVLSPTQEPP